MEFGAITRYVDLAQIILYLFWLFFAGLIYYLVRENHREGYPMETGRPGQKTDMGWFVPAPKVFKTEHGDVTVPHPGRSEPNYAFTASAGSLSAPIDPRGDPLQAGVGAGAWSMRADVPDRMADGSVKIVPLRAAKGFGVSGKDADPRGLPVIGADGKQAGTVRELWVDQAEMLFRYLEVALPNSAKGPHLLLPVPFCRIGRQEVRVQALLAHQFDGVPRCKHPDQVSFLEEDRISAYYGAGTLYAEPQRGEPIL
jgi:photosynthetic reaction center H subunit